MAYLRRVWRQQPPVGMRIDWSHPISRGLMMYWYGGIGGSEAVSGYAGAKTGTLRGLNGAFGSYSVSCVGGNGSSGLAIQATLAQSNLAANEDCTLLAIARKFSGSNQNDRCVGNCGFSSKGIGFVLGSSNGTDIAFDLKTSASSFAANVADLDNIEFHFLVGQRIGSDIVMQADDVSSGLVAASADAVPAAQVMSIGSFAGGHGQTLVAVAALWRRALSQAELLTLRDNPWQLLLPPARSRAFSIPAGGNVYDITLAEAGAGADQVAAQLAAQASMGEAGNAADALSSLLRAAASISGAAAALDALSGATARSASLTDAAAASGAVTAAMSALAALADAGAAQDGLSWGGQVYSMDTAEAASASDQVRSALQALAQLSSSGVAADQLSALHALQTALSGAGAALDQLVSAGDFTAVIVDSANAQDAIDWLSGAGGERLLVAPYGRRLIVLAYGRMLRPRLH